MTWTPADLARARRRNAPKRRPSPWKRFLTRLLRPIRLFLAKP